MKKFTLLLTSLLLLALSGCIQDKCEQTVTYVTLVPEYVSFEDMRGMVNSEGPRDLQNPGKMYFFNNFIFISELNEGVHVINNQDPSNPHREAFIVVPGNRDLAVKGNVLYVDSYTDLVSIDISDPLNASELSRREDIFPYDNWNNGFAGDPALGVVRKWKEEQVTEVVDCQTAGAFPSRGGVLFANVDLANAAVEVGGNQTGTFTNATSPGLGGSLARFTIVGEHLYTVTERELLHFSLANPADPNPMSRSDVGFGIETIFPYQENLFIGSQTGMFIYSLADPNSPEYLSEFQHARNCDPVVVEDDRAYVTLRSGNGCPGSQNLLHVVDISNLRSPNLVASHNFFNPHGLGISNDVLFICDGTAGLKVFDASSDQDILNNMLASYPNIQATDVIPLPGILLMIGEDGFYQYDYSDLNNIYLLSKIEVQQ
jgi:hypothetical protein